MKTIYRILGRRGRITIPYEIRQKVGFRQDDVLSFRCSGDGRSVMVCRERICDCSKADKGAADEVTLFDFLNGLTSEQQRAALIHLSVKWAEKQGEGSRAEG